MTDDDRRATLRADLDRRLDRTFSHSLPGWRTRARRRAVVAAVALLIVAALVLSHVGLAVWGVMAVFVVGAVPMVALRVVTRGIAEPSGRHDEHDRRLRASALGRVYLVAPLGALLLAAYVALTGGSADLPERTVGMLLVLAWLSGAAPTLALAVTMPDDDPADVAGS